MPSPFSALDNMLRRPMTAARTQQEEERRRDAGADPAANRLDLVHLVDRIDRRNDAVRFKPRLQSALME